MLMISKVVYDQVRQDGTEGYPRECCGVLLGEDGKAGRIVVRAVKITNASVNPMAHYEMDSVELVRAVREARSREMEILGFYHSHPDHPAEPSPTDLAEAHWHSCSYMITAIEGGHPVATRSFRLMGEREEEKYFLEEEIRILS